MKGISAIVSAIMLIGVSVSLATIYADWAPGISEDITGRTVEDSDQSTKCRNAALSFQNPYYSEAGNNVEFDLKNTGSISFNKEIKVFAVNASIARNSTTTTGLNPGETFSGTIITTRAPDLLVIDSEDCPSIRNNAEDIEVR